MRLVGRACVRACVRARLILADVERWSAEGRRARSRPRGLVGCGVRRPRGCMYVRTGIQPMQPKAYAPHPQKSSRPRLLPSTLVHPTHVCAVEARACLLLVT